jgi:hypothetical protein
LAVRIFDYKPNFAREREVFLVHPLGHSHKMLTFYLASLSRTSGALCSGVQNAATTRSARLGKAYRQEFVNRIEFFKFITCARQDYNYWVNASFMCNHRRPTNQLTRP